MSNPLVLSPAPMTPLSSSTKVNTPLPTLPQSATLTPEQKVNNDRIVGNINSGMGYTQAVNWNPKAISSSGMAPTNSQTGAATTAGGNVLTSGGKPVVNHSSIDNATGARTDYDSNGNRIGNVTLPSGAVMTPEDVQAYASRLSSSQTAQIDSIYNAQLANQNAVYASAMNDLKNQTTTQHSAWESTAASLNPYASSRTSSNLVQHHQVIDQKATALATELTNKATQAQLALQMGRAKDYMSIQDSMTKMVQNYQQEMNAERWKQANFMQSNRQIEDQEHNTSFDNFFINMEKSGLSAKDIQAKIADGSIKNDALFLEAKKAGLDDATAMDYILKGAQAREDKTGLEWAKFQLQTQKASDAMNKQSNAQVQAAVINAVASIPRPATNASQEEWANYYKTIASKTAGGKTDFRISQDFSNIQTVIPQLGNIKTAIEGLKNTDPLVNLIAGKMPWSEKNKSLEAYLNSAAAPLARLFGEKGTLAEGDVNRIKLAIGNSTSPEAVREKVFNSIVKIVGEKFFNNLEGYANQGYNVSAYAKDIQSIQEFTNNTQVSSGGKKTYTDPVTGKVFTY